MVPRFYIFRDICIARNAKAATSAICARILELAPETCAGEGGLHERPPQTENPDKPVYLLVREPVSRFVSACIQIDTPYERALNYLEQDRSRARGEHHLMFQHLHVMGPEVHGYRFPEHLPQFCRDTGLGTLARRNRTGHRPDLSPGLEARVRAYYADDIALYNRIAEPGVIL